MTEKEREMFSQEMRRRYRMHSRDEASMQRLSEFMRVFTPEGAMELAFQRQQENRELYQSVGIGAIAPQVHTPLLGHPPSQQLPVASAHTPLVIETTAYTSAELSQADDHTDDTPDYDTF
jgi:putative transposase